MGIDFDFLNLITLIGGIQGFSLALFLLKGKKSNPISFRYFLVFILSLALFNTLYALNYMQIYKFGFIPLTAFPIPEDYLIGIGLYFYITRHKEVRQRTKRAYYEYLLFLPVIIYGPVRIYWYITSILEGSNRVILEVYNTRFFDFNEIIVNLFYLGILLAVWKFMNRNFPNKSLQPKQVKHAKWLKRFIRVFAVVTCVNLITYALSMLFNTQDYTLFYYPKLIANSAFIYWIGFVGFTKRNQLFVYLSNESADDGQLKELYDKLYHYMMSHEAYKNPDINLSELALDLEVSSKKLSNCIHGIDKVNFSEYVNIFRIESIKELLKSDKANTFTLVALAKDAGFTSKSSFYATFKRLVGMTPSEYKSKHKK